MISEKCCILEKSRKNLVKFGENSAKFWQVLRIFGKKTAKISAIFNENFEIRERCKGVHCVDLGESFQTHIYLQKSASIQPRTSLVKFARSPRTDRPGASSGARRTVIGSFIRTWASTGCARRSTMTTPRIRVLCSYRGSAGATAAAEGTNPTPGCASLR